MSMIDTSETERRIAAKMDPKVAGGTALATNRTGGVSFTSMTEVMEFAKAMAVSSVGVRKHLRGNVGACLAITVQAIEWEMSPFAVANKSYLVNDQIAYEAQLLNAVILRRAPIQGRFKIEYTGEADTLVCRVWARLRDEDEIVDYESPVFARIQPKNSPLWKTDPRQQIFYYSSRALCRRHFPDVLLGVYAVDELVDEDIAPQPGGPRDVTPKRTLSEKLDALAGVPSHDPETGEIDETRSSGDGVIPRAESEVKAGEASTGVSPAENKARAAVMAGASDPRGHLTVQGTPGSGFNARGEEVTLPVQATEGAADGQAEPAAPEGAAQTEAHPTPLPKTLDAHVLAYVAAATSASALEARWKSKDIVSGDRMGERSLRNALDPDKETFDELEAAVKARCAELKGAAT